MNLARTGAESIQMATGQIYRYGNTAEVMRRTIPGSGSDYAYKVQEIPFVITFEISTYKNYGFHPPQSKILAKVEEAWVGIKAMAQFVIDKHCPK